MSCTKSVHDMALVRSREGALLRPSDAKHDGIPGPIDHSPTPCLASGRPKNGSAPERQTRVRATRVPENPTQSTEFPTPPEHPEYVCCVPPDLGANTDLTCDPNTSDPTQRIPTAGSVFLTAAFHPDSRSIRRETARPTAM